MTTVHVLIIQTRYDNLVSTHHTTADAIKAVVEFVDQHWAGEMDGAIRPPDDDQATDEYFELMQDTETWDVHETTLPAATTSADTSDCPRHGGTWGEDSTCYLCVNGDDQPRDRASLIATTMTVWHQAPDDVDYGTASDALVEQIDNLDDVLFVAYTEGDPA